MLVFPVPVFPPNIIHSLVSFSAESKRSIAVFLNCLKPPVILSTFIPFSWSHDWAICERKPPRAQ